jgi:hypothetical protein
MSSLYVRKLVKSWLTLGPVPFYDTVNTEQKPSDQIWKTVDWGFPARDRETYCGQYTENGTIAIAYFGQPGTGDEAILLQAEADIADLMQRADPTKALVLENDAPPLDFRQSDLYVVEFQIEYSYRS